MLKLSGRLLHVNEGELGNLDSQPLTFTSKMHASKYAMSMLTIIDIEVEY